jgi:LDH2 family malate/lactate/ureidoglycolate dehydrogenase
MPIVTVDQFRQIASRLFKAAGATDEETHAVTESLLWASLHGHDTHGAGHFPMYVRTYMGAGGMGSNLNKGGKPTIVKETPATVVIDANWCVGHMVALQATEMAIEKAKKVGIAGVTVENCPHNGALGFFVNKIVDNDMIALYFTGSGAISPPWGGTQRMLGTNPIGIGIPAKEEPPIIIDMATSSSTWAGLGVIRRNPGPAPEGILLDDDGMPTTDHSIMTGGSRDIEPHGSMTNMANNHKGYAIQLAVEMLGGVLPALMTGNEAFAKNAMLQTPSLIIAINVSFFQDVDAFTSKVDQRIREIRNSKKKRDVDAIIVPGERGARTRDKRLKEGIPFDDHYWVEMEKLADELKVDLSDLITTGAKVS